MIKSWLALKICIRNNLRYKMQNTRKISPGTRGLLSRGLCLLYLTLGPVGPGLFVKTEWNNQDLKTCRLLSLYLKTEE